MRVIYKITNKIDGKIYIGQTNDFHTRMKGHKSNRSHCTYLHRAICKYGWENFGREVIGEYEDSAIDFMETELIKYYDCLIPKGYNIGLGGCSGKICHEETKQKLREARAGKPLSENHKRKLSLAKKGKKKTPEHAAKMTAHFKTMIRTKEHCSNISKGLTGKKLSEEHKKHVKEGRTYKGHSQEVRDKISKAGMGRKRSPESVQKARQTRKINKIYKEIGW